MICQPDNWVILKITHAGETIYKVLAGWSGGYLNGDSWRLNSGITEVKQDGDFYEFYGNTGSCYRCHKQCYRLTNANAGVYNTFKKDMGGDLEMMPENTDWLQLLNYEAFPEAYDGYNG